MDQSERQGLLRQIRAMLDTPRVLSGPEQSFLETCEARLKVDMELARADMARIDAIAGMYEAAIERGEQ